MKITKRDIKVFLAGMLTLFLLETIFYWDDAVTDYKAGYRDATQSHQGR